MGMPQKLLSLVGHGAKTIKFFTFGPEYNFPGNCYSENPAVFQPLSTALRMVARGEDLLHPGKARRPQVAILTPQSSQLWDLEEQPIAKGLIDATNTRVFEGRMQYLSEVFTLHRALQYSAVPVRFVDEQALSETDSLNDYRVLYVTAPDLPAECIDGMLRWVKQGGTLVTVAGTGLFDRYHQPIQTLASAAGIEETKPLRPLADAYRADSVPDLKTVSERKLGKGRIVHFATFPGTACVKSGNDAWRQMIVQPVYDASVMLPATINVTKIEAPVLYSHAGAAVTLLNWSGKEQEIELAVAVDKPVRQVESVTKGPLPFRSDAGRTRLRVPLAEADVILLRY
jgi:hypothetical protein